ncbi:DNA repair protein RAD51 homolog 3 [Drosophila obscura]|uniref:DNA repair protein RAD51 homolog 3 n=1 Tax=Drosophila obscura TaxID=7282 RepID=UPI001BB1714C|nr:DNA repair protein RAD51 homolog 3 [Drosophila obscura]XP_041452401.1 DNA repair protein RAD51 homolog 3 [Drosophila obscura]
MASSSNKLSNLLNNSCLDILRRENQSSKITTGHKGLDRYLGGGIALRKITELVGNSGTGKTKMCLQLCLNVQIPKSAGGLEGAALFIDTRRDFHPDRLQELAKDLERQYKHRAPDFVASKMLQNVHYVSCPNAAQLMATVLSARRDLIAHPNIKVIVIDSLAFSLRMLQDGAQSFELLLELLESMRQLLREHQVAWVVSNVLTNRCIGRRFHVVPALGETYSHMINERIWFSLSGQHSLGKLWKTSRLVKD